MELKGESTIVSFLLFETRITKINSNKKFTTLCNLDRIICNMAVCSHEFGVGAIPAQLQFGLQPRLLRLLALARLACVPRHSVAISLTRGKRSATFVSFCASARVHACPCPLASTLMLVLTCRLSSSLSTSWPMMRKGSLEQHKAKSLLLPKACTLPSLPLLTSARTRHNASLHVRNT